LKTLINKEFRPKVQGERRAATIKAEHRTFVREPLSAPFLGSREQTSHLHKDTISNGRCVEPHREVEDESMEKCSYLHK
jgi:hypothetical protein